MVTSYRVCKGFLFARPFLLKRYLNEKGANKVVKAITRIRDVYVLSSITLAVKATFAKIRPTSPLGTMETPIMHRESIESFISIRPDNIFPRTATTKIASVSVHI